MKIVFLYISAPEHLIFRILVSIPNNKRGNFGGRHQNLEDLILWRQYIRQIKFDFPLVLQQLLQQECLSVCLLSVFEDKN